MFLNYPETTRPPQSVEKLSSKKLVPGAKEFGDCWSKKFGEKVVI